MYWVFINEEEKRILITGKVWDLLKFVESRVTSLKFSTWTEAYNFAVELADDNYVIEWYLEEQIEAGASEMAKGVEC